MRKKLWMGISVVAALAVLVFAEKHQSQPAPVDRDPSREQQPAPTVVRAPTKQVLTASYPKYPSVAAEDEPGAEDVPDWDFESGKTPQIVWEKEEDGWKVSLNEAGMISVIKRVPESGWDYTPEEVSNLEISKRLHREARQAMRRLLPMKSRAIWELERRQKAEKALAASDVRPVDPKQYGYADLAAMKATYRERLKLGQDEDVDFVMRKNDQGKFDFKVRVTAVAHGDEEF